MARSSTEPDNTESGNSTSRSDRTLAIVLGVSEWPRYPSFQASPSFRKSAQDVADYLLSRDGFNLPPHNVQVLIDSPDEQSQILRQMHNFIHERCDDLSRLGTPAAELLFYYVGHGGFGDDDTFFLSVCATDIADPLGTSISIRSFGRLFNRAANLRVYIVLDCCFAASAIKVFQSGGLLSVAEMQLHHSLPIQGDDAGLEAGKLPEYGTAFLCASGAQQPAKAPSDLPYTMFTWALLNVLREGSPGKPALLSLDDLHSLVDALLVERFHDEAVHPEVHPVRQRRGRIDTVPLFRNPARRATKPSLLMPVSVGFIIPEVLKETQEDLEKRQEIYRQIKADADRMRDPRFRVREGGAFTNVKVNADLILDPRLQGKGGDPFSNMDAYIRDDDKA